MNQLSSFPQISSRGRYDLRTGKSLGNKTQYTLYPKKKFLPIEKAKEVTIFVHGMRNSRWGAKRGALTLRQALRKLGYKKHPVVAFSYDADVRGAHLEKNYKKVIGVAGEIAIQNGFKNLSQYIVDLKEKNPNIKIHLVGHSLGCIVVNTCLYGLGPQYCMESVHLFGSPVEIIHVEYMVELKLSKKVVNYYNPTDDVIIESVDKGVSELPSCLIKKIKGVKTVTLLAKDHRFRSYAEKLRNFP